MDIEWSWLLLGLPGAFVLGWLASRMDWRQMRVVQRHSPRSYFQGLTYLLNEQQDKAIDVFVETIQSDPDTIDLHFALGGLFRRRGEYWRAVRVHEHLLARADLSAADRARAQWELTQDFFKAGIYDRAEEAMQPLENTAHNHQAQLALLHMLERTRHWARAQELTERMAAAGEPADARGIRSTGRQMHYWCQQAEDAMQQRDFTQAAQLLEKAAQSEPGSVRPAFEQVRLALLQGNEHEALRRALELLQARGQDSPDILQLTAGLLADSFARQRERAARHNTPAPEIDAALRELLQHMHEVLRSHHQGEQRPSLDVLLALVEIEHLLGMSDAPQWYLEHLRRTPSLVAAARWVQSRAGDDAPLQASLEAAQRPLLRYRCLHCSFEAVHYHWQCPGCQSWESFPPQRLEESTRSESVGY